MDDRLSQIDSELDELLGSIHAPAGFSGAVLHRIRERPLTRMPEVLDFVGIVAVLSIVFALLYRWQATTVSWSIALVLVGLFSAFCVGVSALREAGD